MEDERLNQIIEEAADAAINWILNEGIDIDFNNRTVAYNPNHEENVVTAIQLNPTVRTDIIEGIEVWSIFKRVTNREHKKDGNPLVYVLKKENGWKFRGISDRNKIEYAAREITKKFFNDKGFDSTIIIPSSSSVNKLMTEIVTSVKKDAYIINDLIWKMTIDEVDDEILADDSAFRRQFPGRRRFEDAYTRLSRCYKNMKNGIFTYHKIPDSDIRDAIEHTLKMDSDIVGQYSDKINGKDILLIDDTVRKGITLIDACGVIRGTFTPKSMTVLTMFSPL